MREYRKILFLISFLFLFHIAGASGEITPAQEAIDIENEKVSIQLYIVKNEISIEEETEIILSAVSYINNGDNMTLQTILKIPSGVMVSGAFADQGAGQYIATSVIAPGDMKKISAAVIPTNPGDYVLEGDLIYYFGDDRTKGEHKRIKVPLKVNKSLRSSIFDMAIRLLIIGGAIVAVVFLIKKILSPKGLLIFGTHHKSIRVRMVTIIGIIWTLFFLSAMSMRTLEGNMGTTPSEIIIRIITAFTLFIILPLTPLYFYLESKRPK
jgi:hypothetical protein